MTVDITHNYHGGFRKSFVQVEYYIAIQRKPTYYLMTFVLPCFMITTASIIGIFGPFDDAGYREEEVSLGLSTLLNMAIILTAIADEMPKTSDGLPLLCKLSSMTLEISPVTFAVKFAQESDI